jgi:hypothetical protein
MNTGTAHKRNTQQRAQLGRKIRTSQLGEERGGLTCRVLEPGAVESGPRWRSPSTRRRRGVHGLEVVKWKGPGDLFAAPARCSVTDEAVSLCSPDVRHGAVEVEVWFSISSSGI